MLLKNERVIKSCIKSMLNTTCIYVEELRLTREIERSASSQIAIATYRPRQFWNHSP